MTNTITRNKIKELNNSDIIGFVLGDGEFSVNANNIEKDSDSRFTYGDFGAFAFEHDLKNLAYIILKDDNSLTGSTMCEVVGELTEPQKDEPQETVKSIIEEIQQLTFAPHETSGNDVQVFSDLLTDSIERLIKALGLNDMSLSAESKNKPQELPLKAQVQDLYLLNDSMITADPNHVPKYTDGTIITLSDLVDMNVQALDNIAELIGFELEE
ncbi:hypothetical protein OGZ51_07430 [Lactococcus lactis]|uniref:Uncharacterized protein n=1 Tax=Lactococcus lactis TaxID=1358 RepID=A0A9X4NJ62_9LACT|nr:hypothetical protein [Lactococcus lactis]MDG4983973.1 hypothetical protein [Lactococcus lactis]